MNYIIRAVFNRPEMFYLSIKAEEAARRYNCDFDLKTLFCIEHGAPPVIREIIEKTYPFEYDIVERPFRHFGWGNILEGFNSVSELTDSFMLNLEDDCVVHRTYFQYLAKALEFVDNKCSAVNASNRSDPKRDRDAVNIINKTNRFEATCCLMFKDFYNRYVKPYATYDYYRDRASIISQVNKRNGENPKSKYRPSRGNLTTHIGWDGLVNRLVDTAYIEEDMYCISPEVDRRIHIGFYGQNRPGRFPSNETDFGTRVDQLLNIINDPQLMATFDGRYSDYELFSENLESWDGTLELVGDLK